MEPNFQIAFVFTSGPNVEGGFSDDPEDPGGATMHGIELTEYRVFKNEPEATVEDLKEISVTDMTAIYRKYWDDVKGDELPRGVDLSVFDMGFNAGPATSIRQLQQVLGVPIDGKIGPETMGAVEKANDVAVITALWHAQMSYYQALRGWEHDGEGWERRAKARLINALYLTV